MAEQVRGFDFPGLGQDSDAPPACNAVPAQPGDSCGEQQGGGHRSSRGAAPSPGNDGQCSQGSPRTLIRRIAAGTGSLELPAGIVTRISGNVAVRNQLPQPTPCVGARDTHYQAAGTTTPCEGVENVISMVHQPGYLGDSHSRIGFELNQRIRARPTVPCGGIKTQQHDRDRSVGPPLAPVVYYRLAGRLQATGALQECRGLQRKESLQPVIKVTKDFRSGRH